MTLSIGGKIKQIAGLANTTDVPMSTTMFITSIVERTDNGKRTSMLTEAQIDWIEDIHRKHFGDSQ